MTYIEFVTEKLNEYPAGVPIHTNKIAECLGDYFGLPLKEAAMATSVAFKRIMENNIVPLLRCYQKGIYYKTEKTIFGELGINKELLIKDKYLASDKGYETGLSWLHKMGLTTQMPKQRTIATNVAKECARLDKKLDVIVKPPKVEVTTENKKYLQTLDVLDAMGKAPIDANEPYVIIATFIDKNKLRYDRLLAIANDYYNKNTIWELAQTASAGGSAV